MNKVLTSLILLSIIINFSVISIYATGNTRFVAETTLYTETFDDSLLSRFSSYIGNGTSLAISAKYGSYKARFTDSVNDDSVFMSKTNTAVSTGAMKVQLDVTTELEHRKNTTDRMGDTMRVMTQGTGGYASYIALRTYLNSENKLEAYFSWLDSSGKFHYVADRMINMTYTLSFEIDLDAKVYSIFVDGQLICLNATFQSATVNINKVTFGTFNDATISIFEVDNIIVQTGLFYNPGGLGTIIALVPPGLIVGILGVSFSQIGKRLGDHAVGGFLIGGSMGLIICANAGFIPVWFITAVFTCGMVAIYFWFKNGDG